MFCLLLNQAPKICSQSDSDMQPANISSNYDNNDSNDNDKNKTESHDIDYSISYMMTMIIISTTIRSYKDNGLTARRCRLSTRLICLCCNSCLKRLSSFSYLRRSVHWSTSSFTVAALLTFFALDANLSVLTDSAWHASFAFSNFC